MIIKTIFLRIRFFRRLLLCIVAALAACGGGGGGGGGGSNVTLPPVLPPVPVITSYDVTLDAVSVVTGSTETGTATAIVRHNSTDEQIEVTVSLSNLTASSVSLRRGHAGSIGAEIYALQQGTAADEWTLAPQPFTSNDSTDLQSGAIYLSVATTTHPDGALRGQMLPPGVDVVRIELSPADVTSGSDSGGTGTAWITVDNNAATVTTHVQLQNLAQADNGTLHRALAGMNGPVLETLDVDATSAEHWSFDTRAASADMLNALANGELYVQFTSPTLPAGAIRGQHIPTGMELVKTDIRDDAVVMNASNGPFAGTVGRLMTTIDSGSITTVMNLFDLPGSSSVELRQAPAGQNGPIVTSFDQDLNDSNRWILDNVPIDEILQANLDNQTLYASVATANAPDGAARGQIETATSAAPTDSSAFVVAVVDPPSAAMLDTLPDTVFATLNREPLTSSVTPQSVTIEASGMDGSFGDGNEITIVPTSVAAIGNTIEINLAGVQALDDVFRVTLTGGGASGIVDVSGIALDGDGDGEAGGVYETAFEVAQPVNTTTLTQIQNEIFTPSCASAGCHSGNNPPDGLLLTTGNSWSNNVNIDAVQMNLKRVLPGDPDNSYLVRKIEGSGIVANRMPLGAAPLSQDQINLVRQWVADGAPDN